MILFHKRVVKSVHVAMLPSAGLMWSPPPVDCFPLCRSNQVPMWFAAALWLKKAWRKQTAGQNSSQIIKQTSFWKGLERGREGDNQSHGLWLKQIQCVNSLRSWLAALPLVAINRWQTKPGPFLTYMGVSCPSVCLCQFLFFYKFRIYVFVSDFSGWEAKRKCLYKSYYWVKNNRRWNAEWNCCVIKSW